METVKERLKYFLKTIPNSKGKKGIGELEFEIKTGLSRSAVSNIRNSLGPQSVKKIKACYPNLNEIWLLHGKGEMLLHDKTEKAIDPLTSDPDPVEPNTAMKSKEDSRLDQMLQINKIYADSHKVLVDSHAKAIDNITALTGMVKDKEGAVGELKEMQQVDSARLQVLQELLIEVGVGKLWDSHQAGEARLHKLFSDAILGEQATGIHVDASK